MNIQDVAFSQCSYGIQRMRSKVLALWETIDELSAGIIQKTDTAKAFKIELQKREPQQFDGQYAKCSS
jgi:hypothetical protein